MRKNVLLLLFCVLMSLPALARDFEYTYEGKTIKYTVIDEEAKTCKTKDAYEKYVSSNVYQVIPGNEVSGDLILPEHPKDNDIDFTLVEIGSRGFYMSKGLTSIEIPNSVTKINGQAFFRCTGLTTIIVGESVEVIGNDAFSGLENLISLTFNAKKCESNASLKYPMFPNNLKTLILGETVERIPDYAFSGCTRLTSVSIPNSVTEIGNGAFNGCTGFSSIDIPNSVKSIGESAFSDCSGLTTLGIGDNVTTIGKSTFSKCRGLTSVVIPNSVETIGSEAFYYCSGLTTLGIGDNVTTIEESAFSDCSGLTSVVIPNSVETIGSKAFYNCSRLTTLGIGDNVTTIGKSAFSKCRGLTSVVIPNSVETIGSEAFYYCSGLTTLGIGDNVTTIEGSAFRGCSGLTSVIIGNSVTSIGHSAFRGCSGLTSVVIPNSVTSIDSYAFEGCSGLTSADIPNLVTSIGDYAFSGCSGLTSVVIGNSVTSIGSSAFSGCDGLIKSAYPNNLQDPFPEGTTVAYDPEGAVIEDGWVWGPEKSAIYFAPLTLKGEYTIPETVTSIGYNSFRGCSGLTSVVLCNSVTSIGWRAFYGCSGLTSVVIGNSVTSIGEYAFYDCSGLIKSAYPNNLKDPFWRGIAVAYDPETDIIEDGWVWGPEKSAIYFAPLSLEGEYTIPMTVTSIGNSAFRKCSGLTSVVIPNSVTSIGNYAFSGCSGLTSVIIGNSVTSIGQSAFYGCDGLSSVKCEAANPAAMNDVAFEGLYDIAVLSVPDAAVDNYLTTSWSLFKNMKTNGGSELGFYSDGVLKYRLNPTDMSATIIGAKSYSNLQIPERFSVDSDSANPVRYNIKGIEYKAFEGKSVNTVEFNSRSKMEFIGDYAFAGTWFSKISLPNTINHIGEGAFHGSQITSITIPENVTEIKDYTFYNCTNLTEVNLNDNVESIGESAFSMDEGKYNESRRYGSLNIPSTLKSIGKNAFLYRVMDKVVISNLRAWCDIDFANNDSNPCGWALDGFWLGDEEIVDLVIPDGVEEIKPFSFVTLAKLKSITMPSSVTSIGEEAFFSNHDLDSVRFSSNLKSIGKGAFQHCRIPSLTIPASVEYIGKQAFIGWRYENGTKFQKYLADFKLEDGDTPIKIEADAFAIPTDLTNDKEIRYNTPETFYLGRPLASEALPDGFTTTLENLTIANTIENIPDGLFNACNRISKMDLGSAIKTIGANAFSGCTGLAEVVLSPAVETIGASAFAGNSKMASIIMGHNVKTIGEKAFDGCPASTVSITAQTPPTAPNNTFSVYSGKLYLQGQKAVDAYYDAYTCWDRFSSFVMIDAEKIQIEGADKISGKAGDTFQLTATVWPENVTLPQVFWRSTNPEIATVDANGLVTLHVDLESLKTRAQGEGDIEGLCTIIAETLYNDGPIAQIGVTAEDNTPVLVNSLTIDPTVWSGEEGSEFKISATVLPEDATDKTLVWSSSDETVATVDGEGNVKVLKEGNCTITVATTDGSNLTAQCVITSLSGVEAIFGEDAVVDIYDMNGVLVKRACARGELKELLTPGVYVLRSGNATVKAVIR